MNTTKHTTLITILAVIVALLAAGLVYLATAWADPDGCVNVFGTYQNCHSREP